MYETLECRVVDRILVLTLNRPDHLNAFTQTMSEELETVYRNADGDPDVDAVVVTGAGRAFCAGMDLSVEGNVFGLDEAMEPTYQDLVDGFDDPKVRVGVRDSGGRVSLAVHECRKPVIAAINGAAVGIGATMTLPMDFRFASPGARIGFVFGKLGIVPEACSTWFLPRLVGLTNALELSYSARIIDADEAMRLGLVSAVVEADHLLDHAIAFAKGITGGRSAASTGLIRQLLMRNSAAPDPYEAHLSESLAMFYTSIGDGKEGVRAFLEKREPVFRADVDSVPPVFTGERRDGA